MAEVEEHPQAGVSLVLGHDGGFDGAAGVEDFFDPGHYRCPVMTVIEQVEEGAVGDAAVLDDLRYAVGKGFIGQAVQHVRVHEHPFGLPEGTGQVLACLQVDGHLAAY